MCYYMFTQICSWYFLPILTNMLPLYQTLPAAGWAGSSFTHTYGQNRTGNKHSSQKDSGSLEPWWSHCPLFSCFSMAHKCWGYVGFGWEQSPGPQWNKSRKTELKAEGSAGSLSLPWGLEVVCSKLGIPVLARHHTKVLYFESSTEPWKVLHISALYH